MQLSISSSFDDMSKRVTKPLRFGLDIVGQIIKMSDDAVRYFLTHTLHNEVVEFSDQELFTHYLHIEKACKILQEIHPSEQMIVDVGGADGTTAGIFLQQLPSAKVIVFEPLKENLEQLKMRFLLEPRVQIIDKAVGSKVGQAMLHQAQRNTASSLYPLNQNIRDGIFSTILEETGKIPISITTLDEVFKDYQSIGILKLDVQGFELEVLKGATACLKNTTIIVLEVNNHDGYIGAPKYYLLDEFLRNAHFTLFDIFPSTKDANGQLKEWDVIYINNANV
jgi:FkbM family methyltransferase